jgi:hypothetical protein
MDDDDDDDDDASLPLQRCVVCACKLLLISCFCQSVTVAACLQLCAYLPNKLGCGTLLGWLHSCKDEYTAYCIAGASR